MADKADFLELFHGRKAQASPAARPGTDAPPQSEEGECPAFGYLRGLDARALMVEFRFLDRNSESYPYSNLASCRHNPSVGLLLKFTSDVTTLVLIRGSNLDALVEDKAINLTDRGFQRHRILWVRELDEDEKCSVGNSGPTVDKIEVVDVQSQEEQLGWLRSAAPQFLR
jgi:hypothetical protein